MDSIVMGVQLGQQSYSKIGPKYSLIVSSQVLARVPCCIISSEVIHSRETNLFPFCRVLHCWLSKALAVSRSPRSDSEEATAESEETFGNAGSYLIMKVGSVLIDDCDLITVTLFLMPHPFHHQYRTSSQFVTQ